MRAVPLESAGPGDTVLRGRPSATREEWEAAREADAGDLNRHLAAGGEVVTYVVPLWSNLDAERGLRELRGFDEARVVVEVVPDEAMETALAAVAESGWATASVRGEGLQTLAEFLSLCAGLEIPVYLEDVPNALRALALALGEDLTPREIEAVLRGEREGEPDAGSLDHARELLAA